jgi:hypothetical protein
MQPRRLRLGDVVDDYCSRCRLLSNHAIAAIVDDEIKQTRCSTCDFEHPYKDGKLPARRTKKDGTSALYKQVLDNVTDGGGGGDDAARSAPPARPVLARPDAPRPLLVTQDPPVTDTPTPTPVAAPEAAPALVRPAVAAAAAPRPVPVAPAPLAAAAVPASTSAPAASSAPTAPPAEDRGNAADEGIVHRRLIRATLPRAEGAEREPRPIPTFTVHEAANARGKFRRFPRPSGHGQGGHGQGGHGQGGHGNGNFNGNFNGNAMPRFGHGGQPSPFGAPGRGHGKGGQQANRGNHQGNRANQQRRGNKGR